MNVTDKTEAITITKRSVFPLILAHDQYQGKNASNNCYAWSLHNEWWKRQRI